MTLTKRPGVAIVGCGGIGRMHARRLRPHCDLTFVSLRRASAEALAARIPGRVVGSLDEALDRPDVRGVALATPADIHAEQAVRALRAGKVVLVEKPMAVSPAEVEAIGEALGERRTPGAALMVAENYLYKPLAGQLRQLLPEIAPVRRVALRKLTRQPAEGWRARHGALLEGGIHFVALLGAILDEVPEEVVGRFPDAGRPERHSRVEARYPSGAVGSIHYAWNRRSLPGGVLQRSRVEGERGRIVFESNGLYLVLRRQADRLARIRFPGFADLMGFGAMTRDFRRLLADPSHTPLSDFRRARRDLELVFRACD